MKFTKMHGTGNDYVYVNLFEETISDISDAAIRVSDRHFGIGSDGLIAIAPSDVADCRMIMYNADGTEGAMCGNGIRCVAKYAYDHDIAKKEHMTIETKSGIKTIDLTVENGKAAYAKVNMGKAILDPKKIPVKAEGDTFISQEIMPLYDGSYRVKGSANVEKLFDFFDVDDYIDPVTVNGWVVLELDKLPETGDYFEYKSEEKLFKVRVTKADERKALEINLKVEPLEKTED